MLELIILATLVFVGLVSGTIVENLHYKSINERERIYKTLPVTNLKKFDAGKQEVKEARLVSGSAVISVDYFKMFIASLINIFGGRVTTYETLVDRARREATLRMKKMAPQADIIANLRYETSAVGGSSNDKNNKSIICVEVFAYGTAITYK